MKSKAPGTSTLGAQCTGPPLNPNLGEDPNCRYPKAYCCTHTVIFLLAEWRGEVVGQFPWSSPPTLMLQGYGPLRHPGHSGCPHHLIQLTTRCWFVDSSAPLFDQHGLKSDDTITKSTRPDLWPSVLWSQVHLCKNSIPPSPGQVLRRDIGRLPSTRVTK